MTEMRVGMQKIDAVNTHTVMNGVILDNRQIADY